MGGVSKTTGLEEKGIGRRERLARRRAEACKTAYPRDEKPFPMPIEKNTELYARIARHAGLRQPAPLLEALSALSAEPHEILEMLRRHQLSRLVCCVATEGLSGAKPAGIVKELVSGLPVPRISCQAMVEAYSEIRLAMEEARLPFMLLKGFYFACRFYGGLDRRPQYDIDMLVRRADFGAALVVLRKLGFARRSRDFHSRTVARGAMPIDLHHSPRCSPAYQFNETAVWGRAIEARAGDLSFRTLSDLDYITMLSASIFEDIGFGKGRLKQALDLYLLLRENNRHWDWESYFCEILPGNFIEIAANALALVVDLFAAQAELVSLSAALRRRKDLIAHVDREEALRLVFAPHGHVDNMVWFRRIYPGSMLYYRCNFWLWTFPGSLRNLDAGWFRRNWLFFLRIRNSGLVSRGTPKR
jgi:hypothetical protein